MTYPRPCAPPVALAPFSNNSPLAALLVRAAPRHFVDAPRAAIYWSNPSEARGIKTKLAKRRQWRQGKRWMVSRMMSVSSFLRAARLFALGALSFSAVLTGAVANERAIRVDLDYARIVKIPAGAQTLVIGNPMIADVTMLRNSQLMVITGKSFGSTNLIVLDKSGSQVGESIVTVVPPLDKLVVQRGMHRESYACNPHCAKAVDLTDDMQFMSQVIEAVKAHDSSTTSIHR